MKETVQKKSSHSISSHPEAAMPKEIDFHRYGVFFLAAALLWLYLIVVLYRNNDVYDCIIIEEGQTSFVASFARVERIVPANNDLDQAELLNQYSVLMTIQIKDAEDAVVATVDMQDVMILSNEYLQPGELEEGDVPFWLTVGETYSIQYWAYSNDTPISGLSFAIYGGDSYLAGQMEEETMALAMLTLILWVGIWLSLQEKTIEDHSFGRRRFWQCGTIRALVFGGYTGYLLIFVALAGILLMSAPSLNAIEDERTAFADAYALSNTILGHETVNGNGYVYIEESGIRNLGAHVNTAMLHRFWTDWNAGSVRESGIASTLYCTSGNPVSLFTILDALAISFARIMKAPYQLVYLSGSLVNLTVEIVVFFVAIHLLRKQSSSKDELLPDPTLLMVISMFLAPSTLRGVISYRGYGLGVILGILLLIIMLHKILRWDLLCAGTILLSAVLCVAGIIRIIISGGNVLTVFMNTIVTHADEWFYGMVFYGPEESSDWEVLLLSAAGLMILLWCIYQKRMAEESFVSKESGPLQRQKNYSRGQWLKYGDVRAIHNPDGEHCVQWRLYVPGMAALIMGVLAMVLSGDTVTEEGGRRLLTAVPSIVLLPLMMLPVMKCESKSVCDDEQMTAWRSEEGEVSSPGITITGWHLSSRTLEKLWEVLLILFAFIGFRCIG